jgi:hypothetical protein
MYTAVEPTRNGRGKWETCGRVLSQRMLTHPTVTVRTPTLREIQLPSHGRDRIHHATTLLLGSFTTRMIPPCLLVYLLFRLMETILLLSVVGYLYALGCRQLTLSFFPLAHFRWIVLHDVAIPLVEFQRLFR